MNASNPKTTSKNDGQPRRRRGGQPGNLNALKHGLYSRQLSALDPQDLPLDLSAGLQDEITMLRLYMRRVLALSNRPMTHPEILSTMRALSLASTSLARLLKIQKLIFGSPTDLDALLERALSEIHAEEDIHI